MRPDDWEGGERLAALERVIERGERSFIDTGKALAEIQAGLYRWAGARTFADYLRERWVMINNSASRN